jgi:PAS domain S-box-containing protein
MTGVNPRSASGGHRRGRSPRAGPAVPGSVGDGARLTPFELDHVESVARIGSYALDIGSGRWASSRGLDAIFGIGARFPRTVDGWASLIHPEDRDAMVRYFTDEVVGAGRPFDRPYRILRADTGEARWVHGRGALELDRTGRPVQMFGTIADITDQRATEQALVSSELRYAAIFEGTAEAILIAELATRRYRFVNTAACALFGYPRDEFLGLAVGDIHPAAELPGILAGFGSTVDGAITVARSVPCVRKDGSRFLADIRGSRASVDGVACNIAFVTDVTEVRRLEARDRKLAQALEQAGEAILIAGPAGELEYANPAFERLSGLGADAIVGHHPEILASPASRATLAALWQTVSAGASWRGDLIHRRPDGEDRVAEVTVAPVHEPDGAIAAYIAVERDVTDERALQAERERLAAAVAQTSDSVIIANLAGAIEYVNPAFERVSGYSHDEVIGQNPRILKSGQQSAALYRALWRALTHGKSWTGPLINRRKDGTLYEEEATISPIHGPDGSVSGYVAVKRDVNAVRAAESTLAAELRERAQVAAALARLKPGATAEATAAAMCDELLALPGIDAAAIIDFATPARAVVLAVGGPDGPPFRPGMTLPAALARDLHARAIGGAWAEPWQPLQADRPAAAGVLAGPGLRAVACAPIRNGDQLLGLVVAGTGDDAYARRMIDHGAVVSEFAATARALLGHQLEWSHRSAFIRTRVERLLADRGFRPVFQPVLALPTAKPVGYEALTRFTDGTAPDLMIAEAHLVGLGSELELATLAAAVTAAETMPGDVWLSLNVSPAVILDTSALADLLARRSGPTVLEVTEHAEIDNYEAVREAVARLGPSISLAVDDAGAGFASLRHVVELRPQFLKLDISLVRGVDGDLTRQAMVAGLTQFAMRVRCTVIAEGIERPAELAMLAELGVPLGQGYLLGRPVPDAAWERQRVGRARRPASTASRDRPASRAARVAGGG